MVCTLCLVAGRARVEEQRKANVMCHPYTIIATDLRLPH